MLNLCAGGRLAARYILLDLQVLPLPSLVLVLGKLCAVIIQATYPSNLKFLHPMTASIHSWRAVKPPWRPR